MYTQDFYITEAVGNNAFSFSERHNKKLFVPKLKKIEHVDEIELYEANEEKITFEEYDFDGNMQTCFGLKNLYEIDWRGKKIFLVDNHNHVFYFWYLARNQGIISDGTLLYHIDEHADTRDPEKYLQKEEYKDLQKVFEYTNFALNVGNYIIPAQKEGLISEVVQIRGEGALKEYLEKHNTHTINPHPNLLLKEKGQVLNKIDTVVSSSPLGEELGGGVGRNHSIILNLDLDFFEPNLDFIDYDLKKQVILDIAQKADFITVCTSPYFIEQNRALEVFRDLFDY